jgi:flagellar biosynthetic protein FliQ
MNQDVVVSLAVQAMQLALEVGLPILLVGLLIGLVISVFQAVTQIQEQTLSFIPKILGMGAVMILAGPWMLNRLLGYTTELYTSIPQLIGS